MGSVRVRISATQAWLNIKSATIGSHRQEFEYEIPLQDANVILDDLCHKPLIEKIRHFVYRDQYVWEIDEFMGDNDGLIVAEIELSQIGESFPKPSWIGEEVTHDLRYYNNSLCKNPYLNWNK
jgi:adenylate cyclase